MEKEQIKWLLGAYLGAIKGYNYLADELTKETKVMRGKLFIPEWVITEAELHDIEVD